MKSRLSLHDEAAIFSRYLVGYSPTTSHADLYTRVAPRPTDTGTYAAALRHPALLPYLDAYDAFFRPSSQLRQRLYLMFSILEASPDHTELFLPRQRSPWYVFALIGHGVRGAYRLSIGFLIVKASRW